MKEEIDILLAEDNPGDVRLIKRALRGFTVPYRLHVVEDGEQVLAFLNRQDAYTKAPDVNLILLDWNLPRVHGREVLVAIKNDSELKHIPVVILSTSEAESDVLQAYKRYANCYVTKPAELPDYLRAIETIERFWLTTAKLPKLTA
jgi:chemotaxis family two-component system response regulator Rcp1